MEQWKTFQEGGKWVAERAYSRPGATSSIIRVEAESKSGLSDAVELRESQLTGTEEDIKDTITNDGTLVTGPQHESIRTEGVTVVGAPQVAEPVPNEDEAKQVAGFDSTEGNVDAPQVPADAADKGLSPDAISASETGSGSADTSTDPSAQAMPATYPAPEGGSALADAESSTPESQSTPSAEVDATDAAKKAAAERDLDLSKITGTGKDGRVTKQDVDAYETPGEAETQTSDTSSGTAGDQVIAPGAGTNEPVPSTEDLAPKDVETVDGGVVADSGQRDTESAKAAEEGSLGPKTSQE